MKYVYETGFENKHDKGTVFDTDNVVSEAFRNTNVIDLYEAST
jgi:hypothetical protein